MTEAGKKWVKKWHDDPVSYQTPEEEVSFWLRAFCEEVQRRAAHPLDKNGVLARGTLNAYNELKRELLGE